jgi:hypothetical protein
MRPYTRKKPKRHSENAENGHSGMGRRLFIYYLIQKSLIILMICETIQKNGLFTK